MKTWTMIFFCPLTYQASKVKGMLTQCVSGMSKEGDFSLVGSVENEYEFLQSVLVVFKTLIMGIPFNQATKSSK